MTRDRLRRHMPPLASAGLFLGLLAVSLLLILQRNGGQFAYPLDDTYIHLAVAKHFVLRGVWGVTPFAFTSSVSSPLWTLAISAVFAVFGVERVAPLVMNTLMVLAMLYVVHRICIREQVPARFEAAGLFAPVLLEPVAPMALSGMEHVAQLFADLALLDVAAVALARSRAPRPRWATAVLLALIAAAVTGLHYEGLWLVVTAGLVLAAHRRWILSAAALAGGAVPPVVYGLVSLGHGWFFLPATLLVKGYTLDVTGLGDLQVARWLLLGNRQNAAEALDRLARSRHAAFAMVYRSWLDRYNAVPGTWRELGRWTLMDNFICGGDVVTFFGIDEGTDGAVLAALRSQSARLPPRSDAVILRSVPRTGRQ